jgi:hypothetical protein
MNIIGVILAALANAIPSAAARAQHVVVADSGYSVLTGSQVSNFVAVVKLLGPYWKAHNHTALLRTAEYTRHSTAIRLERNMVGPQPLVIYNYPLLVKKDAALAAIFTKNHFAPQQFAPTLMAVALAFMTLRIEEEWRNGRAIENSATISNNKALVKPYYKDLDAAEFMKMFRKGTGGTGTGDDDDLDP